eukprot:CAMPEP_0182420604 /NCGR_PEP_ID=MMETSP1167-20130531/5523_1 /TAXON_ID=2988 /ORGANISM="Mallomonas Sp, Strain CCMP3275" /LENGTH=230 /DNA_ID=CAMNT_0024596775 /DNA_START=78 /DNA_END=770 /DNA_ORIENTATION=-
MNTLLRRLVVSNSRSFRPVSMVTSMKNTYLNTRSLSSLSDALTEEIMEESSKDEIDSEFLDIKKEIAKTFTIKDMEGQSKVELKRKFKAETITVSFDCQDEEEDGELPDFESDDTEVESEESKSVYNFEVVVAKGAEDGDKLHFHCIAGDTITIRNISYVPRGVELNNEDMYNGPVVEYLAEPLRDAFTEYLSERNIDDDMAFFILSYSRHKEQKEYELWMKNVFEFVEK